MIMTTKTTKRKNHVKEGDYFRLGRHRLLCGDSSNLSDMKKLVGRHQVKLVFAGPPYYNQRSYSHWEKYESFLHSMEDIVKNCLNVTSKNCIFAWLVGRGSSEHKDHVSHLSLLLEKNGLIFQDAIAWIKPGANYSIKRSCHIRVNGYYYPAFKWENIVVYRRGKTIPKMSDCDKNYMARHHTDVWKIPWVTQQIKRFGHPSVCPEEIPLRCIYAYSKKRQTILEPFGGSGTTLIAAEKANRSCLIMEKKPEYCSIIIKRWEQFTKKSAERFTL